MPMNRTLLTTSIVVLSSGDFIYCPKTRTQNPDNDSFGMLAASDAVHMPYCVVRVRFALNRASEGNRILDSVINHLKFYRCEGQPNQRYVDSE